MDLARKGVCNLPKSSHGRKLRFCTLAAQRLAFQATFFHEVYNEILVKTENF